MSIHNDGKNRSLIKLQILFQHPYNFLLLIPQDSKTVLPHEYFLHLFGEEFLDVLTAETNL